MSVDLHGLKKLAETAKITYSTSEWSGICITDDEVRELIAAATECQQVGDNVDITSGSEVLRVKVYESEIEVIGKR